jgi:pimeloyl-ACP methyl ester carboxylesterase
MGKPQLKRSRVLLPVLLGVALSTPGVTRAADKCLAGASAAADATAISDLRIAVETACDCQAFDGSSGATSHGKFVKCAKDLIKLKVSAGLLRKECTGIAGKIYAASTCGFKTTAKGDKVACIKRTSSGKLSCSIKPEGSCTSSGGTTQVACPASYFCLDAADSNGDLLIDAADSGSCTTVLGSILGTTVDIPSAAAPPNTPGTAGVKVTNSSLRTQLGKKPNLNTARFIRFRYSRWRGTPDAVLITVAGFGGGANNFKILAENLLPRMRSDYGLTVQLWAFDRRTNLLEDRAGAVLAEAVADPSVALDWYYGSELGLTLHPALGKLGRRALFYNSSSDVPFISNWTALVFSRDIDAVVEAARRTVRNGNVFLGGHSAGSGFATRYAATDFDLSGAGPPQPGYAKLRGIALFEGTGGSTSGAPLTDDSLDRIVAKFDGGLFGAVRDNAGRCVDGKTGCAIATEATDCAGQVPPKCTPPTAAFAAIAGLSPLIFAAAEPSAIQGESDPDGGQIILQVDQGAPGNNAVAKVPDLALLLALPPSTVDGLFGNFLDDDGLGAQLSQAIAASIGAAGPTVNNLHTWLDLTEGPFASSAVPNNGAAPTTLPGSDWGQEKEVTSLARLRETFIGTSNASDWYYPAAGLSVTSVAGVCTAGICTVGNVGAPCSGATQAQANDQCSQSISLDSSALSIGRGRRDIENLTQAANVNIPLICFGGSNGLTPVPGRYTVLANSLGTCSAPSCTGSTPRVVNASSPNAAFPTFGNVDGGFEVYVSEGFAHLDVITAEDNADNNVLAPLAAFMARNAEP